MIDNKAKMLIGEFLGSYSLTSSLYDYIFDAYTIIRDSYSAGGKLLICGNGGSAGDSDHIVGELMKSFLKKRPIPHELSQKLKEIEGGEGLWDKLQQPLTAISLSSHNAFITAFSNDVCYDAAFAQQVLGYGLDGDVLVAVSTSGNSKSVVNAAIVAKVKGLKIISLTGNDGGQLKKLSDVSIIVPDNRTWEIQNMHIAIYHALCALVEDYFFNE